jgi:hypothetical protein
MTKTVLKDVAIERTRQDEKWGLQNHPDGTGGFGRSLDATDAKRECQEAFATGEGTWALVLQEEVAEALAESDREALRMELVQVAAVAVAWIEALDRRDAKE